MKTETVRAWLFVGNKPNPYASLHPFDALQYAPSNTLCLVACRDIGARELGKIVCRKRRIIARIDATDMLRYFARQCALSVIHLYPNHVDGVVLDYLMTGDESLRAAAGAATWATASAGDDADAWAPTAAWAATWASPHAGADAAAGAATWATEGDDAGADAWDATWTAYKNDFNDLVNECFADYK